MKVLDIDKEFGGDPDSAIRYFINQLSTILYDLAVKIREDKGKYIKQRTEDFKKVHEAEKQLGSLVKLLEKK